MGWAIYISPAEKALLHRDKENIRRVVQQDAKRPAPRVPSRGSRFFIQKKSLPPSNKFLSHWGFHHFPQACFLLSPRVGQKSQVVCGPTSHCPIPSYNTQDSSGRSQDPAQSPRVGIGPPQAEKAIKIQGGQWHSSLPKIKTLKLKGASGRDPSLI